MEYAWLYPIVSALLVAIVGYVTLIRKTSGRIETSEAAELWEEARHLREVYRGDLTRLRERIFELEAEVDRLEAELDNYRAQLRELRRENVTMDRRIEGLENGN